MFKKWTYHRFRLVPVLLRLQNPKAYAEDELAKENDSKAASATLALVISTLLILAFVDSLFGILAMLSGYVILD